MGLDPNDETYSEGSECSDCVDLLFGGSTPYKVLAIIKDLTACPGNPPFAPPPPTGPYCLTQTGNHTWTHTTASNVSLTWTLLAHSSTFVITWPGMFYFSHTISSACQDSFTNQNVCGVGPTWAEGGTVDLFWGPQICKEPCS